MTASITVDQAPAVQYLLRLGDTCLIHAQRLAEWTGHGPVLEEDIAMSNMGLDLLGQARALLTRAGQLEAPASSDEAAQGTGHGHDEDQLAFLRDERDFRNATIAELPRGDFAFTIVRNLMLAAWYVPLWRALGDSTDSEVAAIAGKALKEARYHLRHAGDWTVRLGDGTEESTRRMRAALDELWPYGAELFNDDAIDEAAAATGLGPRWSSLAADWRAGVETVLAEAGLEVPADSAFLSTGKIGRHSEHMGFLLAEMQSLQRSYPQGVW